MQLGEWKRRTTAASFSFKSAQADSSKFTVAMCHAASTASAAYKVCADQDTCSHLACEEAERRPSTGLLIKANNYSPLVSCSAVFFFDEQGIRSKQRKNTGQMLLTESFFFLNFCRGAVSDGSMINSRTPASWTSALAKSNFSPH